MVEKGGGGSVRIKPCEIARQNSEHNGPGTEKILKTVRVPLEATMKTRIEFLC